MGRSIASLKRASAVLSTGGVGITTPLAESPSRDFGSTIFNIGEAGDLQSRRPAQLCERKYLEAISLLNCSNTISCTYSYVTRNSGLKQSPRQTMDSVLLNQIK